MLNRLALSLLMLVVLSAPLIASAQGRPILLSDRRAGRDYALELEFDWSNVGDDDSSINTLLPKVYGSFGLTDSLELEAEIPTVFVDYAPDAGEGDSTFSFGNPFVALFYAARSERSVARIGVGMTAPLVTADADDDLLEVILAPAQAIGTRGMREAWLYLPDTFSLVIPAQVQMRSSLIAIGVDGAVAFLIATDDDVRKDEVEVEVDLGAFVGAALDDITLGVRLQLGAVPTSDGDNAQLSVLPFIQADLDGGGFVHGGLLVALDDPLGVLGDNDADLWAVRVGAGTRF